MARFTLRFIFVVLIFLIGTFIGIIVAEKGIYKIIGIPKQGIQSFQVSKSDSQVEVTVLGKTYKKPIPGKDKEIVSTKEQSFKSIPQKKLVQKTNEQGSSYISEIGNAIGSTLQIGAEKGFQIIANLIK
ncbi:DUF3679 domain-containing protein [Tepidibacillus sp. LV47]|uniref:DUF3679 domain-containing protein n=1 Tax=Tepidibacillus sp. LV47 TaxID=3398228 RepID=UPI003AB0A2E3